MDTHSNTIFMFLQISKVRTKYRTHGTYRNNKAYMSLLERLYK